MLRRRELLLIVLTTIFMLAVPLSTAFADIADGTYEIQYEMKEAKSDNTSIADGYFTKPATLTVENGVKYIQLTVTSSSMIKSLAAPSGPVEVISEDEANETRTVRFRVDGDLSEPVMMDMHIVVPDLYDMEHQARAVFDVSGLPSADASGDSKNSGKEEAGTKKTDEEVENPPTGDQSSIGLYVMLLLGSGAVLFLVNKLRVARE